ncbi:thiamine phosphate synthase [Guyparkeria hydrothermalis]|uniref:thiamine phosphate synthase n=1 Tax=Guyparkeria hydrothermalis TaxID=923 RepID=UPI0020201051|nr:thiamine phosphate synthase [Guyparkeria hydrothermalis]MCL7744064.1 thiamine phosphate synthase [Guyparkeria hydrothermalis]
MSEMMTRENLTGLYVITDTTRFQRAALVESVSEAIAGGARVVQYRDKSDDVARRREEAAALAELCRRHGRSFIVNDDVALAIEVGADGVHLGRDDAPLTETRARFAAEGLDAIIGVSCYADRLRAERAAAEGADYLAFGAMFPSPTKPHAPGAPAEVLGWARERLGRPVCGIGGITATNVRDLMAHRPDMIAVISEVFAAPDIRAAAEALCHAMAADNTESIQTTEDPETS